MFRKIHFFLFFVFIYVPIIHAEDDLAVMGIIKNKVLLRINGNHYTIEKNKPPVHGITVINIERNRKSVVLEVDGVKKTYPLGHGTNTAVPTIKLKADSSGMHKTEGKINRQPVAFIVDTGATYVSINSKIATRLGIDYKKSKTTGKAETAGGLVPIYMVTLDSVEIGTIKIKNVAAAVHEGDYPTDALLGMSFLKQTKMEREGGLLSLEMK